MELNTSRSLSIILPCLNEAETIARVIAKSFGSLEKNRIAGEVIVADNGSTDGSQQLASTLGAKVVHVESRGYGAAVMGGLEAASGS